MSFGSTIRRNVLPNEKEGAFSLTELVPGIPKMTFPWWAETGSIGIWQRGKEFVIGHLDWDDGATVDQNLERAAQIVRDHLNRSEA